MLNIPPEKITKPMNNFGLTQEKATAWVAKHFPDYKTRRDGRELVVNNPFDGDDGWHFNISLDHFVCNDWRGNNWQEKNRCTFLNFVRLYLHCTYREAITSVMGENARFLMPRKMVDDTPPEEQGIELPPGSVLLSESPYPKQAGMLMRWLVSRGVDEQDVRRYKLLHLGSEVIWPYYQWEMLVYWQSRSRLDKRFRFPPSDIGVGKGDFLYGFDDVEPGSHVVVTEAIFDKHTLREQAVATGGAVLTSAQLKRIRATIPTDGVILAPDNDKAGLNSIASNGKLLSERGFKVFYSVPPELEYEVDGEKRTTKDWNELLSVMSAKEIPRVMEKGIKKLTSSELVRLQMKALGI